MVGLEGKQHTELDGRMPKRDGYPSVSLPKDMFLPVSAKPKRKDLGLI